MKEEDDEDTEILHNMRNSIHDLDSKLDKSHEKTAGMLN